MRLLIDTHVFIWMDAEDPQLIGRVRNLLDDVANEVFFSTVSAWEIAIKYRLGKLSFVRDPALRVPERVAAAGLHVLPVELDHALRVGSLPLLHGDPFDRLLVAQGQLEGLTIVTDDPLIRRYDVPVIWD